MFIYCTFMNLADTSCILPRYHTYVSSTLFVKNLVQQECLLSGIFYLLLLLLLIYCSRFAFTIPTVMDSAYSKFWINF